MRIVKTICSQIHTLQSWHHILHAFFVSFSQELVLNLPKFIPLTSHSVLPLSLGSINCHPPLPHGRSFHYMNCRMPSLGHCVLGQCLWMMPPWRRWSHSFERVCLHLCILWYSNQLGSRGRDSSLDPESLEQGGPDPWWVHNRCWLSQLIYRRLKRKRRKHTWWANTDWHLINSCIQLGANTILCSIWVMLRKNNNRIGLC